MGFLDNIENAPLRSEFLRAVNLVTTTQLSMFLDREPPTRASMLQSLNGKLEQITPTDNKLEDQASVMRDVLLESLEIYNDPFATYITPAQLKRYNNTRTGKLLGVGIKFRAFEDRYPVIIGALLGGPLAAAGVKPGDRIIEIAGTDQHGVSSRDVSKALKGEAGSTVAMRLRRQAPEGSDAGDEGEEYELEATRSQIKLLYARAEMLADNVGYIKVSRFGGNTHTTVRALLEGLLADGASRLVLDLRDNPGGSTRAARGIVSLFVDKQNVYCERYEAGGMRELPHEGEKLTDLPLSVVINERSMSSSEIVAGALQDYGRATLVGAPTYGKGLIQKVFNLKAPLGGAVRTTIAAYATPSHTLIHGVGVTPDVFVATAPESLFRETGSLNVSSGARKFKRKLLEERILEDFPEKRAKFLIDTKDTQLLAGIQEVMS